MFDIKMVTTDKSNRRSGLGTDLLRRSVQLATSLGYKVGWYKKDIYHSSIDEGLFSVSGNQN